MESPVVLIALGAVVTAAAAVKAALYLWEQATAAYAWALDRRRARRVLADLADDEGWPNGATTLKQSHQDLYSKLSTVQADMIELKRAVEELLNR